MESNKHVVLKLSSVMPGAMSHYIMGSFVEKKDNGDVWIKNPIRIFEGQDKDGKILYQFIANEFFSPSDEVLVPVRAYETLCLMDVTVKNSSKMIELYEKELARHRAAEIGLILPETKVPAGDLKVSKRPESLRN